VVQQCRRSGVGRQAGEDGTGLVGLEGELEIGQTIARDEHVGEVERDRVGGIGIRRRQGQVGAELARRPGEEPRPSDVGDEADAGLGHADGRPLGDDTMRCVRRDADATAQDDAVHQCDHGFRIRGQCVVEVVLVAPEVDRPERAVAGVAVHALQIAAGAQTAVAAAGHEHRRDAVVVGPAVERVLHQVHHLRH
jgi:hypothetical protein